MPKLTETQLVILTEAAKRDNGAVLPLPESLKLQGGAANAPLKSLLKKGFIGEVPATGEAVTWRDGEDGQRLTLAITDAGLAAIKVETEDAEPDHASPQTNKRARKPNKLHPSRRQVPKTSTVAARPTTKQETLVNLLKQNKGTTLAEIMAATGWQAHSVRGAISGTVKKRLGLPVSSAIEDDRGRVYRIVARD